MAVAHPPQEHGMVPRPERGGGGGRETPMRTTGSDLLDHSVLMIHRHTEKIKLQIHKMASYAHEIEIVFNCPLAKSSVRM